MLSFLHMFSDLIFSPILWRSDLEKLSFLPSCVGKNPVLSYYEFLPCGLLDYSHKTLHFWSPNVWRFSPTPSNFWWHQLNVSQFNSILTLCNLRELRIPQVKGSDHKTALLFPIPKARTSGTSCKRFWPTGYRLEVPTTSPWVWLVHYRGSQNSGKHMDQFIIKRCDKGCRWISRQKRCVGQGK